MTSNPGHSKAMPPSKTLLITGATGKQGGAVIDALLSRFNTKPTSNSPPPFHILALTRNPASPSAQRLLSKSPANSNLITLLKGDLSSTAAIFSSLPTAHQKVHGIFSVQLPKFGLGAADVASEEQQGKDLVDAAIQHCHVERFVYSSVDRGGPEKSDRHGTYVPHFASKFRVENHLKDRTAAADAKMTHTILRTVAFMENLTDDFVGKVFATIWKGMGSQKMQLISTKDIGWFAADALLGHKPAEYENRAISIAGDTLDFAQANNIYREVLGKDIPTTFGLAVRPLRWSMQDLDLMFKWLLENQCEADVDDCRRRNPEMQHFAAWLKENKVKS